MGFLKVLLFAEVVAQSAFLGKKCVQSFFIHGVSSSFSFSHLGNHIVRE